MKLFELPVNATRAISRTLRTDQPVSIRTPVDEMVYSCLRRSCGERTLTIDRLAADLLAITTGHPRLARELDPKTLRPTPLRARVVETSTIQARMGTRIVIQVRVPAVIYTTIRTIKPGYDDSQIVADLLAVVTGHPEWVRLLDQDDILQLPLLAPCRRPPGLDTQYDLQSACCSCLDQRAPGRRAVGATPNIGQQLGGRPDALKAAQR